VRTSKLRSGRRRVAASVSLVSVAALLTAALAAPGPSQAAPSVSSASTASVTAAAKTAKARILEPRWKAVVMTDSKAAAKKVKVPVTFEITGNRVKSLSVRLNGQEVRRAAARSGEQQLVLTRKDGLRIGHNSVVIDAAMAGSKRRAQAEGRFLVGHPAKHLLSVSKVQVGAGRAPAALTRIRAPLDGVHRMTARLNGKRLRLPAASAGRNGRRFLALNLAQRGRLEFGRNELEVRVAMQDGRVHVLRRSFTLDRRHDIASGRVRGKAVVGRTVTLDSSRTRLASGQLDGRWKLLRKPARSHAKLKSPRGTTSRLRPDVPGTYLVGLRTRSGPQAGVDVVEVAAPDPDAFVTFDSAASDNGKPSLRVGSQYYDYDGKALQVVQLDPFTLEGTWASYDATSASLSQLKTDLGNADAGALVVVVAPDGQPALPSSQIGNIDAALGEIGGYLGASWMFGDSNCWLGSMVDCVTAGYGNVWTNTATDLGPFTIVGIPEIPVGDAWRATAAQTSAAGGPGSGGLEGYLTVGVATGTAINNTYTLIPGPDPFVQIDTCASAGGSTCAVTVGDQTYLPTAGVNGIHVVVLDRTTLTLLSNKTVTNWSDLAVAINTAQSGTAPTKQSVVHYVTNGGQTNQGLVIMQSVGTGALTGTPVNYVFQNLTQLGGNPETLMGSLNGGTSAGGKAVNAGPYALVGVADKLPWYGNGIESSMVMAGPSASASSQPWPAGQPDGTINGLLQRGTTGMYAPFAGGPNGQTFAELVGIVFQDPQDFPSADADALAYIAGVKDDDGKLVYTYPAGTTAGIGLSGYPDVRSAYKSVNMDNKDTALNGVVCSGYDFCGPDFDALTQQLLTEFALVLEAVDVLTDLEEPYTSASDGIFLVNATWDTILGSKPPPPKPTSFDWLGFVTATLGLAEAIAAPINQPTSEALGIATAAFTMGSVFVHGSSGGSATTVQAEAADDLSAQLSLQQDAVEKGFNLIHDMILSDYGKLTALADKDGAKGWGYDGDTANAAVDALNASTMSTSNTTLIPQVYGATSLEPDPNTSSTYANTGSPQTYRCSNNDRPFYDELDGNWFPALSRFFDNEIQYNALVLANSVSSGSPQMPTSTLTDYIFGKYAYTQSGAAAYEPDWWRTTYNPPGGLQCHPPNSGASWPPPDWTEPTP
jgi:hypothetical protein